MLPVALASLNLRESMELADAGLPAMTDDDIAELLIDGARHNDAEDVLLALERHINVNVADYMGRTGGLTEEVFA